MHRHHSNRRQSYHNLDRQHHQDLQPRPRSRLHRHSCAGYNDQPTQRRRDAVGKRSITVTVKRNKDHGSRTSTSPLLTSTHAEQSLIASDSLPEYRSGITIAYQMKNPRSYQLRWVSYVSATLTKQYNHDTCTTLIKMTEIFTSIR